MGLRRESSVFVAAMMAETAAFWGRYKWFLTRFILGACLALPVVGSLIWPEKRQL
jgi:hypothetical protein